MPSLISDEQVEQLRTQYWMSADARRRQRLHRAAGPRGRARREEQPCQDDHPARPMRDALRVSTSSRARRPSRGRSTRTRPRCSRSATWASSRPRSRSMRPTSPIHRSATPRFVQLDAFPDTTFRGRVTKISNSSIKSATADRRMATDHRSGGQLRGHRPARESPAGHATGFLGHRQDHHRHHEANVLSIPIIALTVREHEAMPIGDTAVTLGGARGTEKQVGPARCRKACSLSPPTIRSPSVRSGRASRAMKYFEVLCGLRPRRADRRRHRIRRFATSRKATTVREAKDTTGNGDGGIVTATHHR